MKDVQRIAIVDPSDVTREELRQVLLGMDSLWLEAECARYEFFFDVISQSSPDVVIVSLDSDQNKALQLIGQLTQVSPICRSWPSAPRATAKPFCKRCAAERTSS